MLPIRSMFHAMQTPRFVSHLAKPVVRQPSAHFFSAAKNFFSHRDVKPKKEKCHWKLVLTLFSCGFVVPYLLFHPKKKPGLLETFDFNRIRINQIYDRLATRVNVPLPLSDTRFSFIEKNTTSFEPYIPETDLFSLGGYHESIDKLADVVRYLQNPEEYAKTDAKPPNGIIISGPPGVGKTELAKAVAGHAQVPLILVSAAELIGSFVGETEANLRNLFNRAKKSAPCILCIDEIDSIGVKRIPLDGVSAERQTSATHINSQVNQLLTLITERPENVVVIGTTNHFNSLDPALVRPGRLERQIHLTIPDEFDRKQILLVHTKNKKLGSNVSLDNLAALSTGFTGAKIVTWVNEASLLAMREKSSTIEIKHFDQAMLFLEVGVVQKVITDQQLKNRIASHEAGHALVGHLLNKNLYKISIRPQGNSYGYTQWVHIDNSKATKQELLDTICTCLAGRAAEKILGIPGVGFESDLEQAKQIATRMVMKEGMGITLLGSVEEIEYLLQEQMLRAEKILMENKEAWNRIIHALLQENDLFEEDFKNIVDGKSLTKKALSWFGSTNTTPQETVLPLPPKSAASTNWKLNSTVKGTSVDNNPNCPLTIKQVAKALQVPSDKIRKIDYTPGKYNSFEIYFKPSFEHHNHIESMVREMKKFDVDSFYFESKLRIRGDSAEDFEKFVKNT